MMVTKQDVDDLTRTWWEVWFEGPGDCGMVCRMALEAFWARMIDSLGQEVFTDEAIESIINRLRMTE